MCGRFTLRTPAGEVARQMRARAPRDWQRALRYNIAPTQEVAVVRAADGGREIVTMQWGLVPSWADDPKIGGRMINARSETAAEKPAFRAAMKSRRCLIPADGFYEWKKAGKERLPYYIRLKDDGLFAFAGLWERWRELETCTILTTSANELLRPLHDRMPVILSAADYDAWLDPATIETAHMLEPYPAGEMTCYEVSQIVNSPRNDSEECLREPGKGKGMLF